MRSEQLEYVATVVRLGSFRQAAAELHISQPALSESVRSLERELGIGLLERGRHGARVSDTGRELMAHILGTLDSLDRLREAADQQHRSTRVIRVGLANAATAPFMTGVIRQFRETHPTTEVEVIGTRQADVHSALLGGGLHLGLVNYLDGDDTQPELETTTLLRGRPVVCMRPDSPLASAGAVPVAELRGQPLIVMRAGYVMHRYLHRLLGDHAPPFPCSTDSAEMGKVMVAEGLGVTVLPSYSVVGDPLERSGAITWRPIAGEGTGVRMVVQRARTGSPLRASRELLRVFTEHARAQATGLAEAVPG